MPAEKHAAVEVDEIQPEPIAEERDALGIEVEDDSARAHLDFLTSIILIIISIAVIITSIGYWQRQKVTFYESAGFMPVLIAGGLLIMSLRLLREALKQDSVHSFISRLKVSFGQTVRSNTVHRAIIGLIIFGIYVFVLLGRMPFWLASFLPLAAVLVFVRYDGTLKTALKMILIAALCVAGIVGLFQFAFAVPMP